MLQIFTNSFMHSDYKYDLQGKYERTKWIFGRRGRCVRRRVTELIEMINAACPKRQAAFLYS